MANATIIPNPDPSIVTSEAIDRRVDNAERVISARIEGMEKAVGVFQSDLTRVPTQLDRAIGSLRDLIESRLLANEELNSAKRDGILGVLEQRLDGMDKAIQLFQKFSDQQPGFVRDQVMHLRELHEAGFESIRTQFTLLKQATEQLDLANKTAIAAALQAQKESAGETQKSSQAAIAKSENSTSEAIKALTNTFTTAINGLLDRFNDLKSRMDRGEGRTSPETTAVLSSLTAARDQHIGGEKAASDGTARMLAMVGLAIAAAVGIGEIIVRLQH